MKQGVQHNENGRIALICAGSNVTSIWGDPQETIRASREQLSVVFDAKVDSSRLYSTPGFPAGSGPDFVNAAFRFKTDLPADEILQRLHEIEASAERVRDQRWAARTLDLDLIGLGSEIAPSKEVWCKWHELPLEKQSTLAPDELILPHPRVQDRAFALVPLADVSRGWIHPILDLDIQGLIDQLPPDQLSEVKPLD